MGAVRCPEAAGPAMSCDGHEAPACAWDDVTQSFIREALGCAGSHS